MIDVTNLSSRGQIVIPQKVRERLSLKEGEKFVVTGHGDVIVLKKLRTRDIRGLAEIIKRTREFAKSRGITEEDVSNAVKRSRSS